MTRGTPPLFFALLSIALAGCDYEPCEDVLPRVVDTDTTAPSCVRIEQTSVRNGAVLIFEPGTRVEFGPEGYLHVNDDRSGASLVAVSPASEEPITFSSAEGPLASAGDWGCVRIDKDSFGTMIQGAQFEYGGAPCLATGTRPQAMLVVNSEIAGINRTHFQSSAGHGLMIQRDGRVIHNAVSESSFVGNALPSVQMGLNAVYSMGRDNQFLDADDYIAVDTVTTLDRPGNWLAQPVPYRLLRDTRTGASGQLLAAINTFGAPADGPVAISPGTVLELDNGTIEVLTSTLEVRGTAANPVIFTSVDDDPTPGSWGCLRITPSPENEPSSIEHAIFRYGGSGIQCDGYGAAIVTDDGTTEIRNATFEGLAGSAAIATSEPCPGEPMSSLPWCGRDNNWDDGVGQILCNDFDDPAFCPGES